jgi:hypothetical protein
VVNPTPTEQAKTPVTFGEPATGTLIAQRADEGRMPRPS